MIYKKEIDYSKVLIMKKISITILTTTYNRCGEISRLYHSLKKQTCKFFEWIVIDDGSTDDTSIYFKSICEKSFKIKYYYKPNSGKSDSINYAHKYINGKYTFIVDSDDFLVDNAIKIILEDWKKYENRNDIACLSYHKVTKDGKYCSRRDDEQYTISNHIEYRINGRRGGDRAEIIRTDILEKFPFPYIKNENFLSEIWLWNTLSLYYQTVYINKAIYVCEYLDNGLSSNSRLIRWENPISTIVSNDTFFVNKVNWKLKLRRYFTYVIHSFVADIKIRQILKKCKFNKILCFLLIPICTFMYLFRKKSINV